MRYRSTRSEQPTHSLSEAMSAGLAPDGGLFVPERLPQELPRMPESVDAQPAADRVAHALRTLTPFFTGDVLQPQLEDIVAEAFSFELPLRFIEPQTALLELFLGPTAAFKDVGARFLASCLSRLNADASKPLTILVATSGDTGGAVASAFWKRPGVEVFVLYPKGRVSKRQELQLTTWGENIRAFEVEGDFDDCQRLVKAAFQDQRWRQAKRLSSANSINIGRLLPQMVYYVIASHRAQAHWGQSPNFVVPTGNLGNALACVLAKRIGAPIGHIHMATNRNDAVVRYLRDGAVEPQPAQATLANAMDVSAPSNLERLQHHEPNLESLRSFVSASAVNDAQIRAQIEQWGAKDVLLCPHTACGMHARAELQPEPTVVVATAHPAKFEQVVEPLVQKAVPLPASLEAISTRTGRCETIAPALEAFSKAAL